MTYSRTKTYIDGDFFTAGEANHMNDGIERMIDGYSGGTYTLQDNLYFTGISGKQINVLNGINVSALSSLDDVLIGDSLTVEGIGLFHDSCAFSSDVQVSGTIAGNGNLLINGTSTLNGTTKIDGYVNERQDHFTQGSMTVAGIALFKGASAFSNDVNVSGQLGVNNNATINGNLTTGGDASILGTCSSRFIENGTLIGTNANTTVNCDIYSNVIIAAGVLSADRNYTLTGGSDGMRITFSKGTGNNVNVSPLVNPYSGGGVSVNLGNNCVMVLKKVSGSWYVISKSDSVV